MHDHLKKALLQLARDAMLSHFDDHQIVLPDCPEFQARRGVFVTLHKQGRLRGCIGYIKGYKNIRDSVVEMANSAAFHDSRFPPVKVHEMADIAIEISILSELEPVTDVQNIEIGKHGLLLQHPQGSGLFLPQVPVEWNWNLKTYLQELSHKAGLHSTAWQDKGAQIFSFTADVFSEDDFLA